MAGRDEHAAADTTELHAARDMIRFEEHVQICVNLSWKASKWNEIQLPLQDDAESLQNIRLMADYSQQRELNRSRWNKACQMNDACADLQIIS